MFCLCLGRPQEEQVSCAVIILHHPDFPRHIPRNDLGRRGPISRLSVRKSGMPGRCLVLKGQFTLLWRDNFWSQPHTSLLRAVLSFKHQPGYPTNHTSHFWAPLCFSSPRRFLLGAGLCWVSKYLLKPVSSTASSVYLLLHACSSWSREPRGEAGPRATTAAAFLLLVPPTGTLPTLAHPYGQHCPRPWLLQEVKIVQVTEI